VGWGKVKGDQRVLGEPVLGRFIGVGIEIIHDDAEALTAMRLHDVVHEA